MKRQAAITALLCLTTTVFAGCTEADDLISSEDAQTANYCVDQSSGGLLECDAFGAVPPPSTADVPVNCSLSVVPWDPDYCGGVLDDGTLCGPTEPPWAGPDPSGCLAVEERGPLE